MAKGGKSSASSGTRKKHVRKAAKDVQHLEPVQKEKKPKGKDNRKNLEPRKKVYIPPVKPVPIQQDPVDTLGLAQQLPADLLVVLRRFSKKDTITKTKALEELQVGWVDKAQKEDDGSLLIEILGIILPVWVRNV